MLKNKLFAGAVFALVFGVASTAAAFTFDTKIDTLQEKKDVQTTLNMTGAGLTVDGVFGPATMSAVKTFQTMKGLTPDGIIGAMTRAALTAASAAGQGTSTGTPVAGCTAGALFSSVTGAPCTTVGTGSTAVSGGAGDLTVTASSKNTEGTIKEGTEEKVLAFKVEADDSDIKITNAKLVLKNNSAVLGSEKLADYASEVKVYLGSKEVASVDAADFSRESGAPDVYTKSVTLSDAVVKDGATDYLYVAVVSNDDMDAADVVAGVKWSVDLSSVRFVDGTGAIMTDSTTAPELIDFTLSSADDSLAIKSTTANPDDMTVKVEENDNSVSTLAVAFKLDVDEDSSGMDLQTIQVKATTNIAVATLNTVAEVEALIDSVTLKIAGEEFDAEDIVLTDLNLTGTYTVITYTFDIDGNVTIDSGDVEEAKVYATFYEQGDLLGVHNYDNGTTVKFAVASTGIEAEVDGDTVASGDISGAQSGALLTLNSTAATVTNVKWAQSTAGTFLDLFFTVSAEDEDFSFLTNTVLDAKSAGTAAVVTSATNATVAGGAVSKYSGDATAVGTATDATAGFKVNEGDTATFRVRYSLGSNATTPVVTANNGMWLEVKTTSVAGQTVADDLQTSPTATVSL